MEKNGLRNGETQKREREREGDNREQCVRGGGFREMEGDGGRGVKKSRKE